MIKISNNDVSNITYGNLNYSNNKIEKVYLGDSLIWPSNQTSKHLTPEFEVVDGIENASGNFEDVYDTSLNAWFKKAKQYDPSQPYDPSQNNSKIVTTSKYILYGDGHGGRNVPPYPSLYYENLHKTAYFFIYDGPKPEDNLDFVKITDDNSYIELETSDYRGTPDKRAYLKLYSLRDFVPLYNQEISFKVDSLDDNYVFTLDVVGKIKIISNPFDPSTNGTFVSDDKITIKPTTTYQTLVFQDWSIDDDDYFFANPRRIYFSWRTTPDTPIKKGHIKIKQNVYYPYYFEGMYCGGGVIFENNEFKAITEPEVQLTEDFPQNIPISRTITTEWLEEGKDWQTDGGKAKDGFVYHTSNPYPEISATPEKYIRFNKTDDYGNINAFLPWQAGLKCPEEVYRNDSSMPKGTSYDWTVSSTSGPYMYFGGVTDASSAQRLHFMSAYLYDMRQILPKKDIHNYVKYSSVDELELNEVPYVGMVAYIGSGPDYEKYQFVYENSEYKWKDTGEKLNPYYAKYSSVDELEHVKPYVGMYAYVGSGSDYEKYQFVYENFEYKWKDTGEKLSQ